MYGAENNIIKPNKLNNINCKKVSGELRGSFKESAWKSAQIQRKSLKNMQNKVPAKRACLIIIVTFHLIEIDSESDFLEDCSEKSSNV